MSYHLSIEKVLRIQLFLKNGRRNKIMATSRKVNLTLEEQIGFSAGEIYEYLHTNGTTTFAKMKKDLDLKGNFADLGLGWLARENKVDIQQKGPAVKVSLR
jgi:hypothetical protein